GREQDYFADGIVEDIITALSRFRSFAVIARNSSFVYKGQAVDIRHVADDLGVRYVLRGDRGAIRSLALNGNFHATHWMLIAANAQLGRIDEARRRLAEFRRIAPEVNLASIRAGATGKGCVAPRGDP